MGVGSGGGVLLDTIVSSGILGLSDVGSSPLGEEGEGVEPVKTGKCEGGEGGTTDGVEGIEPTTEKRGMSSCLFAQDLQDHSGSSQELLPFLAGRLDESPESVRTLDRRRMIIVPEQSPSYKKGGGKRWETITIRSGY